jgi:hypothetical protein
MWQSPYTKRNCLQPSGYPIDDGEKVSRPISCYRKRAYQIPMEVKKPPGWNLDGLDGSSMLRCHLALAAMLAFSHPSGNV